MRLLVIEDDVVVADFISISFTQQGDSVTVTDNGRDGLSLATTNSYDALIVDRMLPEMEGLEVIRKIRSSDIGTPILILSALADVEERVAGLEAGADDYLVKPFAFSELSARVNVLLRRVSNTKHALASELKVSDLCLNLVTRKARRGDKKIDLQPREFRLLEFLMRHAGEVMTRTMLLEHVWDYYFDPRTNIIDVHVSRIRQKIDRDFDKPLIHTVRGAGYVIREPD